MQKQRTAPAGENVNVTKAGAAEAVKIPDTNLDAIERAEREERQKKKQVNPCGCGGW